MILQQYHARKKKTRFFFLSFCFLNICYFIYSYTNSLDNVCAEPNPTDSRYLGMLHKMYARHQDFPRTQPKDAVSEHRQREAKSCSSAIAIAMAFWTGEGAKGGGLLFIHVFVRRGYAM